ncbi:MAG: hypothetical protein M5U09_09600 [Gammaproteobacteria bacterium]|nr:hypothetical protein [Gammaproteobacteria bacterium]
MALKIGVDTGGTYTDAVLFDDRHGVVAAAKSLTTPHDLAEGIGAALAALPADRRDEVELVSLSTTPATNAVVEGRGAPVCTLLPGFSESQVARSGLADAARADPVIILAGGHTAGGAEREPLDLTAAARAVERHASEVSAFAVSAMFAVRNPAHEIALKRLIRELTDRPVTCGHELSASLNAPSARADRDAQRAPDAVHPAPRRRGARAPRRPRHPRAADDGQGRRFAG